MLDTTVAPGAASVAWGAGSFNGSIEGMSLGTEEDSSAALAVEFEAGIPSLFAA